MASVLIRAVKKAFGATRVIHGADTAIAGGALVSSSTRDSHHRFDEAGDNRLA